MPFSRRMAFANLWLFEGLVEGFFEESPITNAMIRTTTAATIINAGVKANVLPSTARAVINFRIIHGDTVESVVEHVRQVVADERVKIEVSEEARDPSSVSSLESPSWTTLQRTIRELYPDAVVVPSLLVGGSDSRHFTPLTDSVYRFAGVQADTGELRRAHGTDERISLANLEQLTRFFIHLIRNSSEQGS
jgi:carboxypeptidase PM20D1